MVKITKPIKSELKSLTPVLETAEERAILIGSSKKKGIISFGRREREFELPVDSQVIVFENADRIRLEELDFDENDRVDYPAWLKKQGVKFKIPRSLPDSPYRRMSRFKHAFVYPWIREEFYIGHAGWARVSRTDRGDWKEYTFVITVHNRGSFTVGNRRIDRIRGEYADHHVAEWFLEKVISEQIHVSEGEEFLSLISDAHMKDEHRLPDYGFDNLRFISGGECYYCDDNGRLDARLKTIPEIRKELETLARNAWITDWDDINNPCCWEDFTGTNLEYVMSDPENAADLEEYKKLVAGAIPEDEEYHCSRGYKDDIEWRLHREGTTLQKEISKAIAQELRRESVAYEDLVLRLAFYLSSVKCKTAHCGRRQRQIDFGKSVSPTAQPVWKPQAYSGMTADCRSFISRTKKLPALEIRP